MAAQRLLGPDMYAIATVCAGTWAVVARASSRHLRIRCPSQSKQERPGKSPQSMLPLMVRSRLMVSGRTHSLCRWWSTTPRLEGSVSIVSRNQQGPGSLAAETTLWPCCRGIAHSRMPFKVFEALIVVCAFTITCMLLV